MERTNCPRDSVHEGQARDGAVVLTAHDRASNRLRKEDEKILGRQSSQVDGVGVRRKSHRMRLGGDLRHTS